jgi:hypothetical protein
MNAAPKLKVLSAAQVKALGEAQRLVGEAVALIQAAEACGDNCDKEKEHCIYLGTTLQALRDTFAPEGK